MKYIVSWKIELSEPKKMVLKGETRSFAQNLDEALEQIRNAIQSEWQNSKVQVVEYGRNFPDEISSIPEIKHIKVRP